VDVLDTAGALLGTTLSDPVDLGGGARCTVLRCRAGDGNTVVVKAFADRPDALACFTAEAAGLRLTGHGPRLLASDVDTAVLVLADLGTAPSLADVLLGTSPAEARSARLGRRLRPAGRGNPWPAGRTRRTARQVRPGPAGLGRRRLDR
jgi:aminoglycoside/choline kinase family phosphotransferase